MNFVFVYATLCWVLLSIRVSKNIYISYHLFAASSYYSLMIIVGSEDVRKQDNISEEDTTSDISDVDEKSTTLNTSSQEIAIEPKETKPNPLMTLLNGNQRSNRVAESSRVGDSEVSMPMSMTFQESTTRQSKPVSLMSILNGNKQKAVNEDSVTGAINVDTMSITLPFASQSDVTENAPKQSNMLMSVLNGNKSVPKVLEQVEQTIPKETQSTKTLEEMVYSNVKSTTVKDLFSAYKKQFDGKIIIRLPPTQLLKIQSAYSKFQPSRVTENTSCNNELESRIFLKAKSTSARDLFNSFKPKTGSANGTRSYMVTLKLDAKKLAKVSYFVTKGNNSTGRSCKNLFSEMMSASRNVKLIPLQKAKELNPLPISKTEFHIFDDTWNPIKPKPKKSVHLEEHSGFIPALKREMEIDPYVYETKEVDKREYALKKLPCLQKMASLNAIFNRLDNETRKQLWVDKYQPKCTQDLLMHRQNIALITQWINNSFEKLKTQAPVKNLNRKLKKRRVDTFIVEDEMEEEICSPFLILQGSNGSGKSTAVYTAMKELDGYVHEINSGMARGRKDIYNSLKELSTTQLVHDTKDSKPGLIFFEDVNILFEQDKSFWSVVQDIINVSKRPIVITCEELWNIPKNLVDFAQEDNSIIFIDDKIVSRKLVIDYLWMCCLAEGFDVGDDILEQIVDDMWNGHNYDLRGCLMSCEILCKKKSEHLVVVRKRSEECTHVVKDLQEKAFYCELNSCGDVIESCCESQIPQTSGDNELFDIYCVDDSLGCLPFELNVGEELEKHSKTDQTLPSSKFTFNDLQFECQQFIGSRSKKFPSYYYQDFEKRATRSSSDFVEPTTGIPETSFIYNISPTSFILDLLPFTRVWQAFQTQLDIFEAKTLEEEKPSLKKFLQYRDFQHKSTLNGTLKLE
ncbi:hypothetical protein CORT_0D00490 [Candida orthopsilosis Co 90-125]|uniref:Uncharacterized protein n=1 Tax=Candida orthopsilosis (strain 90-125) TaxID=1136231 RepID=H8X4F5_CANO9|nr:hypothetical protein CORT_0D00490 [Candida orthopsilosis Co 90-125]CCG22897.1 hypothetical protein CORT_0D00490 [Candida orthopsilosis Co 90-125]